MDAFAALKNAVNKEGIFTKSSVRNKIRVLVQDMEPTDSENTRSYENFAREDNNLSAVSVFKLDAAGELFDEVIDVLRIFDKKVEHAQETGEFTMPDYFVLPNGQRQYFELVGRHYASLYKG